MAALPNTGGAVCESSVIPFLVPRCKVWLTRQLLQNSLSVQVLRCPTLAALLRGTPAVGVSQTLQRGTRNGITELSQKAPPIFGWAAITLGLGPHFSFVLFLLLSSFFPRLISAIADWMSAILPHMVWL